MLLKTELTLGSREFEAPVFAYNANFFQDPASVGVTADFIGNFRDEEGEYKIGEPSGSDPVKICDTNTRSCCTTNSFPGSCFMDQEQELSLENVDFSDKACGGSYSYYLFGKRNLTSGHSFKLCAIGDPQSSLLRIQLQQCW